MALCCAVSFAPSAAKAQTVLPALLYQSLLAYQYHVYETAFKEKVKQDGLEEACADFETIVEIYFEEIWEFRNRELKVRIRYDAARRILDTYCKEDK